MVERVAAAGTAAVAGVEINVPPARATLICL